MTGGSPPDDAEPSGVEPGNDPGTLDRSTVVEHFTGIGTRPDLWRAFELVMPTHRYLNLGYSGPGQTHVLGDPQARLATRMLDVLAERIDIDVTVLLDVGCGRGGPTRDAARKFGATAVGIDLVAENLRVARDVDSSRDPLLGHWRCPNGLVDRQSNGGDLDGAVAFVQADARSLPVGSGVADAAIAVDAMHYVSEKTPVYEEFDRALAPGGAAVVTDLLVRKGDRGRAVDRFCRAWDLAAPLTPAAYRETIRAAGLQVDGAWNIAAHSLEPIRRWTSVFEVLDRHGARRAFDRLATTLGIDPSTGREQIRAAHAGLPALEHGLFVLRPADGRPD